MVDVSKEGWSGTGGGGAGEDKVTEARLFPNRFKRLPTVQMLFFLCVFARSSQAKNCSLSLSFFVPPVKFLSVFSP